MGLNDHVHDYMIMSMLVIYVYDSRFAYIGIILFWALDYA